MVTNERIETRIQETLERALKDDLDEEGLQILEKRVATIRSLANSE